MDVIQNPQVSLKQIVEKIEKALIPENEKEKLYEVVLDAIHKTVWPLLVKYMPKDKVDAVLASPDTLTVDAYTELVDSAMQNDAAGPEIEAKLQELMSEITNVLSKEGIA
jgi:hypothetical protein